MQRIGSGSSNVKKLDTYLEQNIILILMISEFITFFFKNLVEIITMETKK